MKKKSKASEAAAILGNRGGAARAKRMTAEERQESARRAAEARWGKWESKGCPNCGNHSTVVHPGEPVRMIERKTVMCAVCYTKYRITGKLWGKIQGPEGNQQ